jgi:deazaflavin-dependent oxidoreductase (nitroreductase family)
MADMDDFNTRIIEEFRANQGRVGGQFEGAPVLLLTTIGAKSGKRRVNPMMYKPEGERLFVFASKAGADTNPDWFHNVVANPNVTVEVGEDTIEMTATVVEGAERDRVYAEQAELYPGFAEYQAETERIIPVVALDRR